MLISTSCTITGIIVACTLMGLSIAKAGVPKIAWSEKPTMSEMGNIEFATLCEIPDMAMRTTNGLV